MRTGNQKFLEKAKELGMRFVFGWSVPQSLDWFKTMTKRLLDMGFTYEDFIYKGLLRDEFVKADISKFAKERSSNSRPIPNTRISPRSPPVRRCTSSTSNSWGGN